MSSNRAKLIAQGKTLIQPLSWRSRWWPSLKKRFDLLIMLGVIAVIVSIILIAIPLGFLQTAGIALLATALSLISSTITGRQAVHQQFAKDANLVRKNESYAPLQEELNPILHGYKGQRRSQRKQNTSSISTILQRLNVGLSLRGTTTLDIFPGRRIAYLTRCFASRPHTTLLLPSLISQASTRSRNLLQRLFKQ